MNTSYYQIYGQIARNLPEAQFLKNKWSVTLIGSHWWVWESYWITQYVLGKHHELIDPHFDPKFKQPVNTKNVVFIDDEKFLDTLSHKVKSDNFVRIRGLNNQSSIKATFLDNVTANDNGVYPNNIFSIMILNENHPTGKW